jgi:hypothetical protein
VRVRRAHDYRLERAFIDVVGEAAVATQQPIVLNALNARAEPACRHDLTLTLSPLGRGQSAPQPASPHA